MEIEFRITPDDVVRVKRFVETWANDPFVVRRYQRNVAGDRPALGQNDFWEALISALLTTQQRSGPESAVSRFIRADPFPVSRKACMDSTDAEAFIASVIKSFGGIRRGPTIASQAASNVRFLEDGGWSALMTRLTAVEQSADWSTERATARYLAEHFAGLGPKQARNVLQMIGVTRFETPLDSRVLKWLNDFGFPMHLSATGLGDRDYYELVADGFRELCAAAGVYPCVMDAAIFTAVDGGIDSEVARW